MKKSPELLAPAGNAETAVAAYEAGADAVYCGLGKFKARERAENFTPETLGKVLEFAHSKGRKLYLTLNTLLKEQELPQAAEYLGELVQLAPDALIVQDFGVLHMIRTCFPQLTVHASTQMGIHNSAGVAAAARAGIKRVILERQITLKELRMIARNSPVELEVFVHGSLCCSLSGRCLLSSHLGGWSGNRGKCKQPCRRLWQTENGAEYALSPKDLYGLDLIEDFRQMGIASLKIEGRLRSPDYVWKTVRAYRLMLDAAGNPSPEVREEAEILLRSTATRQPSHGFYSARTWKTLLDTRRPGTFGNLVGTVKKCTSRGLAVAASGRLHLGDRLRLVPPDGGEGESFSLIAMDSAPGVPAKLILPGTRCFLPGSFKASEGFILYKIGENGFDFSRQTNALPLRRYPLELNMELSGSRWKIRCSGITEIWSREVDFVPASKCPFSREQAIAEFASGVPHPWRVDKAECRISGAFFVPASLCKQLRREFWQWASSKLNPETIYETVPQALMKFYTDWKNQTLAEKFTLQGDFFEIPGFLPETELAAEKERIAQAYRSGVRQFAIGGLHGLELLRELPDVTAVTCFPLPVSNSQAAQFLKTQGIAAAETEPELDRSALAAFTGHSPLPLFQRHTPLPLLATRLHLTQGRWRDRCGRMFEVRRDERQQLTEIYAAEDARGSFEESEWL